MTPEEFRQHGHLLVDWIADYLQNVEKYPVLSALQPNEIYNQLPTSAPQTGEPFDDILRDVEEILMPGVAHWQSPNFYAYFPCNSSGPSILGELLSAGLGVQGMLWATSPACTELETRVLDWLVDALGLPQKFSSQSTGGGVIQDSASSASLCAMLAARESATGFQSNLTGVRQHLTAYVTEQTHSSVEKAMRIAGLGSDNLRKIATDDRYAMKPDALAAAVTEDRQAGRLPFFVCATLGTTSSNAFDPLEPIGRICREHSLWLHVDAAMSGTAFLCPEFRHLQAGVELADSYCFNPHKWMLVNFDCDCFYVADRSILIRTLSILPDYLKNQATQSGAVFDYRDWQIPLGRRFRSLKLWFVLRSFGLQGLQQMIRTHVQIAQDLAKQIAEHPQFELVTQPTLNLLCFRCHGDDAINERLLQELNATGRLHLTHTRLGGRFVLRMCIAQGTTTAEHVQASWQIITDTARRLNAPSETAPGERTA